MSQELKNCPFCGASAEIEHGSDHHGEWFNLGCSKHWGRVDPDKSCIGGRVFYTEIDKTEAEAIAAWNRRSDPILAEAERALEATEDRAEHAERRLRHTKQWYAERLERITSYAKEHGFWGDMACIIANGSLSGARNPDGEFVYDPPTYAQQLNAAIHRAEAAEERASVLQGELDARATLSKIREQREG